MPPTKSAWEKDLNCATVWIDGCRVDLNLDGRGFTWDGPGLFSGKIVPNTGNPTNVSEWLEAMRDTFRDAAKAARAMEEARRK